MNRFVIADPMLCTGCYICKTARSETHRQHGLQSMSRLKVILNEKESAPQLCHHCEDVPCAVVYLVNAITRVDGTVQLNESLYISCKLCGIACLSGAIEFFGSRPLDIPANASTPKVPPASSVLARVSILPSWVPDIRVIAVECDPCSFDEQSPACVRMCPTKTLHLVDNTDIARVSKHKRESTFSTNFDDPTLFQQAQSGEVK